MLEANDLTQNINLIFLFMLKVRFNLRNVVAIAICLAVTTTVFSSCDKATKKDKPTDTSRQDSGVVINGVRWATRNVDKPGTFAANPEDAGMFYQWNRKKAWAGEVTGWDNTMPEGASWEKANDPSPAGWRVPTLEEIKTLFDINKVSCNEWTIENGIKGIRFTDIASGKSIFLPTAGYCNGGSGGTLFSVGTYGRYWSSTQLDTSSAYCLHFNSACWSHDIRWHGYCIRSVAK